MKQVCIGFPSLKCAYMGATSGSIYILRISLSLSLSLLLRSHDTHHFFSTSSSNNSFKTFSCSLIILLASSSVQGWHARNFHSVFDRCQESMTSRWRLYSQTMEENTPKPSSSTCLKEGSGINEPFLTPRCIFVYRMDEPNHSRTSDGNAPTHTTQARILDRDGANGCLLNQFVTVCHKHYGRLSSRTMTDLAHSGPKHTQIYQGRTEWS